jgi:dTDP-4-dehydrorhamnose reductase
VTAIINTAAYTAVDLAENESALAFHINSFGARNLALVSKKFEIPLIHISTDYVFDGTNHQPYIENDAPNPISTYGKSKLEGEEVVLELAYSAYIIRTSWLYSGFGKNFLTNITNLALKRESLSIVSDQIGSPTYAHDLAEAILELLPNLKSGTKQILHYSNQGIASWYDFAYEIINLQNIDCNLTPIPTTAYPTPAARPYYSILDKTLISSLLQSPISHWKDSLKRHLKT